MLKPDITAFFDPATSTYSYVVRDPSSRACAIVDPVLDYDPAAGRTSHASAERLIAHVRQHDLQVEWLLETHVHADHLSAAIFLQRELGGCLAIGARITQV
ncbi:MBL fold metallo-hydrolase, partial [Pseudomonas aeruginosa]